jgi:hypothetical protein
VARFDRGKKAAGQVLRPPAPPDHHQSGPLKMAENTVTQRELSNSQIGVILNDIAMTEKAIQRFSLSS